MLLISAGILNTISRSFKQYIYIDKIGAIPEDYIIPTIIGLIGSLTGILVLYWVDKKFEQGIFIPKPHNPQNEAEPPLAEQKG